MPRVTLISLLCTIAITIACADTAECPPETRRVGSRCLAVNLDNDSTKTDDDPTRNKIPGQNGSACLLDEDDDGYGAPSQAPRCTLGVLRGDCDDESPETNPGAPELCADGVDNNCDGMVDEPHRETCNGLDDDCDGIVDNGVLSAFYPDGDGDGFGNGQPVQACEAPVGYAAARSDCDDANEFVHPNATELCDGRDNNCDGRADEPFECTPGAAVTCTTACGSAGTGTCSAECELPSEAACEIPEEACNLRDDNCDGLADEGLLAPLAHTLHTLRTNGASQVSVASVPRAGGGAWVLYRPVGSQGAQQVTAEGFDQGGRSTSRVGTVAAATEGSGLFAADGDGRWVIIASAKSAPGNPPTDTARSLRVQLFDAKSLELVAEHEIEHTTDAQEITAPYAVSLLQDAQGGVHALVVYLAQRLTQTGAQRAAAPSLRMRVLKYTPGASWTATGHQTMFAGMAAAEHVAVTRLPCRDEWLVAQSTGSPASPTVHRVSLAGRFVGAASLDTLENASFVIGLRAAPAQCADDDPEMVVAFTQAGGASRLRRWLVDRGTGALLRAGEVALGSARYHAALAHWGGRWFVAAATGNTPQTSAPPYLAEVDFDSAPALRPIGIGQGSSAATPGALFLSNLLDPSRVGLVQTGAALVLSVPNSFLSSSNLDALHQASSPNSNERVMAVSYTIACP